MENRSDEPGLFPDPKRTAGAAPLDLAIAVIDRNLVLWEALRRRVEADPRRAAERRTVADLGRDLRALRDCARVATHARVRQALLREASTITRRMRALTARLRLSGFEIVPLAGT